MNVRTPLVSIVIVGYNSREWLDQCIGSLERHQSQYQFEVVFVDNASQDGSADHVASNYPCVRVIEAATNLGYAGGNNLGASHARGDYLVFLNPDTEIAPGWLDALVEPLLNESAIGLTTSKVLMMHDHSLINACGNEISLAGVTWCRGAGAPSDSFQADSDVSAVSGCSFAISSALFSQLAGFDERFFMYLEDTDLSWRARSLGYRCRYVSDSVVYHDYQLSLTPQKILWIETNRYRMLGKHLSLRSILALSPALAAAEVLTWGYAAVSGPRCFLAKARATVWAATQIRPVIRAKWRPDEARVLRQHRVAPPVVESIGGTPSRVAQSMLSMMTHLAGRVSMRLLPAGSGSGPNPVTSRPPRADSMQVIGTSGSSTSSNAVTDTRQK